MQTDFIKELKERLEKGLDSLDKKFLTVRAGRANPTILDGVMVLYYGNMTPLKQVANILVPEARQLLIKPYDKSTLSLIEKAIFEANLGFTPTNDGESIRILIPQLTEERRIELTKQAKQLSEEAKVAVRNIRHDILGDIEKEDISEDMKKNKASEVQELVNLYNKKIEEKLKEKEQELLSV